MLPVVQPQTNTNILLDGLSEKNERSRIGRYVRWLAEQDKGVFDVDLATYRDTLQSEGMSPRSVAAHLSTIRSRYNRLMKSEAVKDTLYTYSAWLVGQDGFEVTPANIGAYYVRLTNRIKDALEPDFSKVEIITQQDKTDSENRRLTALQSQKLVDSIPTNTLKELRNKALISLLLATGLREGELVALTVDDLRQTKEGLLCIRVKEGKGNKMRLVPYGANRGVLKIVDQWLQQAGITEGVVFRSLTAGKNVRDNGLDVRDIQRIVAAYPVEIDGKPETIKPHDLRRTYARLSWEIGMRVESIQQNLGHVNIQTTLGYIGDLDAHQRQPSKAFIDW